MCGLPQHPCRVHGGQRAGAVMQRVPPTALFHQPEPRPEQRQRRGGTEADDGLRAHTLDLARQPRAACLHVRGLGVAVQALLAAPFEAEMLDCVGQVQRASLDSELGQRTVQQLAGGTDEGTPRQVLHVAGLLANQFGEAEGLQVSSLMYAALLLVVLTLFVNIAGEAVLRYTQRKTAGIR